jgi:hypothetical protein
MDPPTPQPLMQEVMQYHEARAADPGLTWLREELKRDAASGL